MNGHAPHKRFTGGDGRAPLRAPWERFLVRMGAPYFLRKRSSCTTSPVAGFSAPGCDVVFAGSGLAATRTRAHVGAGALCSGGAPIDPPSLPAFFSPCWGPPAPLAPF